MPTQPTIAMIPSGYGLEKIYSVLPTNGDADLQFSRGSVATRVDKSGLISNVQSNFPRLDYLNSTCPSLLLEPQRTNLLTYSNDFAGSTYNKNSFACLANQSISPEGLNNASLIYQTANGDRDFYVDTPNRIDVFSVYAKSAGKDFFVIFSKAGTNPAWYNLANGTLGTVPSGTTATITPVGNGWYRLTYYRNVSGVFQFFKPIDSNGSAIGIASGTDGALIYGAQLESGSFATSYIPTTGTSVTRNAETASKTGVDAYINDSEGVLFVEISNSETTNGSYLGISNGGTSERLIIGNEGGFLRVYTDVNVDGNVQSANTDFNKIAVKYNSSNTSIYYNGFLIKSINQSANLSGISALKFTSGGIAQSFYGKIKDLRVYNTALTDSELETLVSYTSFNAMALNFNYTIY